MHGRSAGIMSDRSESPLSKRRLTICIVGSGGVGKSSLTVRYLQGTFPEVRLLMRSEYLKIHFYFSCILVL